MREMRTLEKKSEKVAAPLQQRVDELEAKWAALQRAMARHQL